MIDGRTWVQGTVLTALVATLAVQALPVAHAEVDDAREQPVAAEPASGAPSGEAPQGLPWQSGPAHVDLGHELGLDLPAGYMFLPKTAAAQVLERMGNFHNDDVLGLASSEDEKADWFVVISYEAEGYVKDDETIDADELLSSMRDGSEAANEERQERGFKPLTLEGWAEPPHYDAASHNLVWGLVVSDADGKSVNYDTRVLGRRGFASLNLVTDPAALATYKPEAAILLGNTRFDAGARYEDYDPSSDKTAEYGLAGLIAAGAGLGATKLVKIGLLAKFWKLLVVGIVAGKKVIALGLIAAGAAVKKLLGGRNKGEATGAG